MSNYKIAKPTLNAAQIMADLDSVNNCDPPAAISLLNASKNLSPRDIRRRSKASILPDPPKFDSLGKRIVVPALSRLNSDTETGSRSGSGRNSVSSSGSGNKTVAAEGHYETDKDMLRAKELVELFEKKEDFRHMGTTGLGKSKARVDEVVQRHAQKHMEERQRVAKARQFRVR